MRRVVESVLPSTRTRGGREVVGDPFAHPVPPPAPCTHSPDTIDPINCDTCTRLCVRVLEAMLRCLRDQPHPES